jgi:hypothetical protein
MPIEVLVYSLRVPTNRNPIRMKRTNLVLDERLLTEATRVLAAKDIFLGREHRFGGSHSPAKNSVPIAFLRLQHLGRQHCRDEARSTTEIPPRRMILVDTSIWIDLLRANPNSASR